PAKKDDAGTKAALKSTEPCAGRFGKFPPQDTPFSATARGSSEIRCVQCLRQCPSRRSGHRLLEANTDADAVVPNELYSCGFKSDPDQFEICCRN
ncbi:hypothetical protein, partial [Sinorhizobium medicae]|uniref:hypothetical protein n=1 Tax=Sinorhizobium medicae TaxID=110321 RepID=UPI0027DDF195